MEGDWPLFLTLLMCTLNIDSGVSSYTSFKRLGFQTHGLFSTHQPEKALCESLCQGGNV